MLKACCRSQVASEKLYLVISLFQTFFQGFDVLCASRPSWDPALFALFSGPGQPHAVSDPLSKCCVQTFPCWSIPSRTMTATWPSAPSPAHPEGPPRLQSPCRPSWQQGDLVACPAGADPRGPSWPIAGQPVPGSFTMRGLMKTCADAP